MKSKTIFILLVAFALLISSSVMASKVSKVSLQNANGSTVATIAVEGPLSFTHQTEVAKDGKPFRVIVDVLDATFNLGSHKFTNTPKCPVKAIRSSQFAVNPQKVVRVVFDMDTDRTYIVEKKNNDIVLTFNDNSAPFQAWSTKDSKPAEKPVLAQTPKSEPAKVASKPEPTKTVTKPAAPKAEVNKTVTASKPKAEPTKTASVTKPQSKSVASLNNSIEADRKESLQSKPEKPAPPKKAEAKPQPTKTVTVAKAQSNNPAPKKAEVKAAPQKTVAAKPAQPKKPAAADTKKQLADKPAAKPEPAKATVKVAPRKTADKPAADKKELASTESNKTDDTPAVKSDEKTEKETSATSRFRRSPAMSKKIQGTMVAEFPKRLVIKYKAQNRRDPFETLINEAKQYNDPIEKRIPNIEGLRLVGIIESDDTGNRALFEDNTGFGYILQSGDKVRNGYVLRIDDDRVFFQIFEYGWSRTVSLVLES